ncbi:hypothetical protein D3C87_421710 [compost metagenome]
MSKLKYYIITLFFFFAAQISFGQGIPTYVSDFKINNNNLLSSTKIALSTTGSSTSVKYNVTLTRAINPSGGPWSWYPTNMLIGLGTQVNGQFVWLDGSKEITNSSFGQYNSILDKEYTANIDHSKLPAGGKIYLVIENHPSNVPSSLWFKEAYHVKSFDYEIPPPVVQPPSYDNWINDIGHFAIYNNDIPPAITWNKNLVNTNTVSLELYQYGVSRGFIGKNIPNTGSYTVDYSASQYGLVGGFNKYEIQIKIISDANPSISDMTKKFDYYQD